MLRCEQLEGREVPAGVSLDGGVLSIETGDAGSYLWVVDLYGADGQKTGAVAVKGDLGDGNGWQTFEFSGVQSISYVGGAGNDTYLNHTALSGVSRMGAGNDAFYGGYGREVVDLGSGNDYAAIKGTSSDVTCGSGRDVLQFWWSSGTNVVHGFDPAMDVLYGKTPIRA